MTDRTNQTANARAKSRNQREIVDEVVGDAGVVSSTLVVRNVRNARSS